MKITNDSHLDHGLSTSAIAFLRDRFADKDGFFVETVDLPGDLTAPCGLYGPTMGDAAVAEVETAYALRGDRPGLTRSVRRPERPSRLLTVIAGPAGDEPCVLYTAFGGPCAPREPWDPSLDSAGRAESQEFWGQHALAWEGPALVNLTPHALELQGPDGTRRTLPPSGSVARLAATPGDVRRLAHLPVPVAQPDGFGPVEGLPEPKAGVSYVVSGLVGAHVHKARRPRAGHGSAGLCPSAK